MIGIMFALLKLVGNKNGRYMVGHIFANGTSSFQNSNILGRK